MIALIDYTPQTRPLRRMLGGSQKGAHRAGDPITHQASAYALTPLACPSCGGKLQELTRARVFGKREDGQRYRCVSCSHRYIFFMGDLLQL